MIRTKGLPDFLDEICIDCGSKFTKSKHATTSFRCEKCRKKYYKDYHKNYKKLYREKNIETITKDGQLYYQKNKDIINAKERENYRKTHPSTKEQLEKICIDCGQKLITKFNKKIRCDGCQKEYKRKTRLESHPTEPIKEKKCIECGVKFTTKSSSKIRCDDCQHKHSLELSNLRYNADNPIYPLKQKTCIDCSENFSVDRMNTSSLRCEKCQKIFFKKYHTEYTKKIIEKRKQERNLLNPIIEETCADCDDKFKKRKNNINRVRCTPCQANFKREERDKRNRNKINKEMREWRNKNPDKDKDNQKRYLHTPKGRAHIRKDRDIRKREYGNISLIPDSGYSTKFFHWHHIRKGEPWTYPILNMIHESVPGSSKEHYQKVNELAGISTEFLNQLIEKAKITKKAEYEAWLKFKEGLTKKIGKPVKERVCRRCGIKITIENRYLNKNLCIICAKAIRKEKWALEKASRLPSHLN